MQDCLHIVQAESFEFECDHFPVKVQIAHASCKLKALSVTVSSCKGADCPRLMQAESSERACFVVVVNLL